MWGFLALEVIRVVPKCQPTPVCCSYTPDIELFLFQPAALLYLARLVTNTVTLWANWEGLLACQAHLLVSFSFSSLSLSATHLGLVIHDSWSRVSKFNLRCDKTAHIYKLCAESLPIWIVLTSFFCQTCAAYQTHNMQAVCTKGRSTNRLNGEKSCQSNDKESTNKTANGICQEWKRINLQLQTI